MIKFKWVKDTASKYIVGILVALTFSIGGMVKGLWDSYVSLPMQVEEIHEQRVADSLEVVSKYALLKGEIALLQIEITVVKEQLVNIQKSKPKTRSQTILKK